MIEMTIHTKTEVELRTARTSWTTPRAGRETKRQQAQQDRDHDRAAEADRDARQRRAGVAPDLAAERTISPRP